MVDLMDALGIDFDITDTFHITLSDGKIVAVEISSNDLPEYSQAEGTAFDPTFITLVDEALASTPPVERPLFVEAFD